jgi:drug/metabolite transporter (DMT)-like permease
MSKKLGLCLMFVGAYITILGGLFFLMHFFGAQYQIKPKDYEWVWGLITGIVMCIGSVFATKKNEWGYVGFGIHIVGIIASVVVLIYGATEYDYLSPFILIGIILSVIGLAISVTFHIINDIKRRKYGESLL